MKAEALLLGQAQARPGCSKLVSIAVGDFAVSGLRLSPLPRDRKRVFISNPLSTPDHGLRHPPRAFSAISRTSIVWFVSHDACLDCIALGSLQDPRSSRGGTCVVWPESGMKRGMGCIKFETAFRIHFRKDQAPPPWKPFGHPLTNFTFSDMSWAPAQSRHAAYMSILYIAATALYEESAGLLLRMSSHHSQQLLCQTFLLHVYNRISLTS